jgi:prepilin-type N-terminal cleavage/methylation domain-containing protein
MSHAGTESSAGRGPKGFTLLELLVSAAVFSLVASGMYVLYTTMQGTLSRGEMNSDLQQNARIALDRMIQELRMAGYDPQKALTKVASQKYVEIRAAGAGCLSFVTYWKDHTTSPAMERSVQVSYYLNGTSLQRKGQTWDDSAPPVGQTFVAGMTQPIAGTADLLAVDLLAFSFYDAFSRALTPAALGGCPPGSAPNMNLLDPSQVA